MSDLEAQLERALRGRYVVQREIGSGGMATVFLATDLRHNRRVAVKVLKPELAQAIGAQRFLREIEIAAQLNHPNVLPLLDSGDADGLLYYAMPFVEGESLADRLKREKQLPIDDAVEIAAEVCDALAYAHSLGLVHRDIKPENILFQAGRPVVTDFGIARAVSSAGGARLTETGLAVGTPAYMSPEQAAGESDVDGRSDIYSMGCVVYQMLAGVPPFTGSSAPSIMARHAVDPVASISTVRAALPPGIETAVMKALAKVPADRFKNAAQFGGALKAGQATVPTAAVVGARSRRRVGILAAIALVVLAAAGVRFWPGFAGGGSGIRSLAVLPFTNLTGDAEQEYFVTGVHDAVTGEVGRIGALRVISRTSAMRYRNGEKSIPEIARELDVDGIVEGSVFKQGDSVRLQVRLIEARPEERQLWTQSYGGTVRNVLALYGAVAQGIAQHADVRPTAAEARRLARTRELDPRAQDAYLRAKYLLARSTPDGLERGLELLHEAVDIDPTDPRPWSALAGAYVAMGHSGRGASDAFLRAKAAARQALALDSAEGEAYLALADVAMYEDWDWDAALQAFQRALELIPNEPNLRYHYTWYHQLFHRPDSGVAELERAKALDPLSPRNVAWLGWLYWREGRYREAIDEAESALQLAPDFWVSLLVLGKVALSQKRSDDALRFHRRLAETAPYWRGMLGNTLAATGHADEARQFAAELARDPTPIDLVALGSIYTALGDHDAAIAWLERASKSPHAFFPWIGTWPELEPLHGDPRFQDLMRRLALQPSSEARRG